MSNDTSVTPPPQALSDEEARQMPIGRRMVMVMQGVERLVKSKQMEQGQKYKYVSHDQVVEAVRGLMCTAGIVMQQRITHTDMQMQQVESGYGNNSKTVTQICYNMRMEFDFCSADDLDDKVTVEAAGMGIDRSDKATGKAMSYCKKYAILQAFLIATGDDPDHDQNTQQGQPTRAERQQQASAAGVKANPANPAEQKVDWNKVCQERFTRCAEDGLKDAAGEIWRASRTMKESPQVLAIKLKSLLDKANQVLNDDPNEPPF